MKLNNEMHKLECDIIEITDILMNSLTGYETLQILVNRHDGKKYREHASVAYRNAAESALLLIDNTGSQTLEDVGLPDDLNSISMEAFKEKAVEIGKMVWRAIADAVDKLRNLVMTWYRKISEYFSKSGMDAATDANILEEFIDESDKIFNGLGIKRGSIVSTEDLEKIEGIYGEGAVSISKSNVAIFRDDYERDILKFYPELLSNNIMAGLALNGDASNIPANIKDTVTILNDLANGPRFMNEVAEYYNAMVNITNRDGLTNFLDNKLNLTPLAFNSLVDSKYLTKTGSKYKSDEVLGGHYITVSRQTKGASVFPQVSRGQTVVRKPTKNVNVLTLKDVILTFREMSNVVIAVEECKKSSNDIFEQLSSATRGRGSKLREQSETISSLTAERDSAASANIQLELKAISQLLNSWRGYFDQVFNMAKASHTGLEVFNERVMMLMENTFRQMRKERLRQGVSPSED